MTRMILVVGCAALSLMAGEPLAKRIGHTDPTKFQLRKGVHAGAGEMRYTTLLAGGTIKNLGFVHRGIIEPKGGIGHHFHNATEEMFLIFGDDAQFTVDGRTSVVKGPAGVPVRSGHSHAIYNPSDKPIEWMNISVRLSDGPAAGRGADPSASFDLGDARVGAPLDAVPVFMTTKLHRELLRPAQNLHGGRGTVQYRRALGPSAYNSKWAYVDHLVIPAGTAVGRHVHAGVEEFYYVMQGEGKMTVEGETAPVRKGDAVPIFAKETHALENTGTQELEVMVVGIALEKGIVDSTDVK